MPFAWIYDGVTRLRNHLYSIGIKPSTAFDVPVVSIGNLTVGGTGKTPMTEYLIRLITPHAGVAVLSRGYGRKTKGVRVADDSDIPATIGDEPMQVYRKFGTRAVVSVAEDRVLGIAHVLNKFSSVRTVILDDAFQHRRVRPAFSVLLTRYSRPFYKDAVLPAGLLRESRKGASRADVVVVTKCPAEIPESEQEMISTQIRRYTLSPVFFASLAYGQPVSFGIQEATIKNAILLVTGIADPEPLVSYCKSQYDVRAHLKFHDHHNFREKDFEKIRQVFESSGAQAMLTTEKDYIRLFGNKDFITSMPCFYLPVEMQFVKNGEKFDRMVLDVIKKETR